MTASGVPAGHNAGPHASTGLHADRQDPVTWMGIRWEEVSFRVSF